MGATRIPERDAGARITPQTKWVGILPGHPSQRKETPLPVVTVGQENSADVEIYYEDHGAGQPVVLIHGYPLSGRAWNRQVPALLDAGYRVITYDRRGFGKSSQPASGYDYDYDYDTFAADLNALLEHLDLRGAVLVGYSMGTGEVVRYLSRYGSARVAEGVLVAAIPLASDPAFQANWNLAVTAQATAAVACTVIWATDFRDDLPKIDVPVLVIRGDADQAVPLDKSASRLPGLIKDLKLVVIEDGPHAISWTHAGQVNAALLDFIRS